MPSIDDLRDREIEILRLVATGASNKEIAARLHISTNTVKVHLRNIFMKINVNSRTEAAMFAVAHKLVQETMEEAEIEGVDDAYRTEAVPVTTTHSEQQDAHKVGSPLSKRGILITAITALLLLIIGAVLSRYFGVLKTATEEPNSQAYITPSNWSQLPPLPTARYGLTLVAYEGKIYAIGGMSAAGVTGAVDYYDPLSNRWRSGRGKPTPVKDVQGVVLAGKIYVPGGLTIDNQLSDRLEIYDPSLDVWSEGASIPHPVSAYSTVAFDGSMYLFGGWDGNKQVDWVIRYNPLQDQWKEMPAMPTARRYLGAAVSGRKIFVLGGEDKDGALNSNEVFLPDSVSTQQASWQIEHPLPEAVYGMGVASIADMIYLVGGLNGSERQYQVLAYDPIQDWRYIEGKNQVILPFQGLTSMGQFIYLAGGKEGDHPSNIFLQYQAMYSISLPIIVQ